jgi:predicted transcriptional regulator
VHNGYVAEAPPGSGRYEITDEGWAVVKSNTVEVDDDYIDTILP